MSSISRIERWIDKARNEHDEFDKYISYFIAFNMLCSSVAKKEDPRVNLTSGDSRRAFQVAEIIQDKSEFVAAIKSELLAYVEKIPVESEEYWEWPRGVLTPISYTLNEAIYVHDSNKIIEFSLKWLYKVRCEMFHGGKDYDEARWGNVLRLGNALLGKIVSLLLREFTIKYGDN